MKDLKTTLLQSITGKQWKKIGVKPHHGINLPLSALRSQKSSGIGEFFDLIPLINWCEKLNLDTIQLLPLNEPNSPSDPSPYNAISSCAINPLYLSLHVLPDIEHFPSLQRKLKNFISLNTSQRIVYEKVLSQKMDFLHEYYDLTKEKLKSTEVQQFIKDNSWIQPYALFVFFKKQENYTPWKSWRSELRNLSSERILDLCELHKQEISFYIFLQYLCFIQLKTIKEYAKDKGIFLMGDIPILLSQESADVWQHFDYFDTNLTAGAPPDIYNKDGQNWGMPLLLWDTLKEEKFQWWQQRLLYAENFFDLFRIDHVIGFFRIWAIDLNQACKEGRYLPEDPLEWEAQGEELLTMIATTSQMLPIAEDLGTVPNCVRPCLKKMGISSTKVMRWERKWEEDGQFLPIQHYPPISITCVSTHDSETLTLWWEKFPQEAKAFADFKNLPYLPHLSNIQREEILMDAHHSASLFHVNLLQEYLAFFPELIWPDPEEERINIPGTVLSTNWTYRFRPFIEEITSHQGLFSKMQEILPL